jgi:hydrogenase expression/formation protein HypD
VVGGFELLDLLEAISMLVAQLEAGRAEAETQYVRSVSNEGKPSLRRHRPKPAQLLASGTH